MMKRILTKFPALLLTLIVGLMASPYAFGGVTIVIQNDDPPGVGFNDPTPATPVGGNVGITLGQQRLNAFQFAANVWGATLNSTPPITVRATWEALTCTSTTAVLGSAGAASVRRDFAGATPGTWYGAALANSISGSDPFPASAEITARFNISIGNAGCLDGSHWYLGLDGNHGNDIDLVSVLIHEFGHGLGFQSFTNTTTGALNSGLPSVYDRFLLDNSTGKTWAQMTDAERAASAINTGNLVWNGAQATSDARTVLGTPRLRIKSPSSIAGSYPVGAADFGPSLSFPGIAANVVQAFDPADSAGGSTTDGCSPITNTAAVSGKIALIDRGSCNFTIKVKNAQNAGAIGVLIAENTTDTPPSGLGGTDSTINIPAVRITQADGSAIKGQLASGVGATLLLDRSTAGGADPSGHPRLFTPNPIQSGSSVSHWDTAAFPNQLMEPNISNDLSHSVRPPQDLTASLFKDIGWTLTSTLPAPTSPPGNDSFASAQTVSGCSGSATGTSINATKETGEPVHSPDSNAGGGSVWYQWQAPSSGSVTITTLGSGFDTMLAVYTGSNVSALTPVVKNDDVSNTDHTSSVTFNATAGTLYKIAVDGWGGDRSNIVLNWTASNCGTTVVPALLTEDGTNVVAAVDAVTQVRGPFPILSQNNFSGDHHTRVMIFTANLGLSQPDSSILSVQAQGISLPVEGVGTVPGFSQFSYIILRLTDQLPTGNLPLVITLRGVPSSITTIGIK